jgi:hypothetical protein
VSPDIMTQLMSIKRWVLFLNGTGPSLHPVQTARGARRCRQGPFSGEELHREGEAKAFEAKAFATRKIANLRHGACRKASRSRRAAASADAVLVDHLA